MQRAVRPATATVIELPRPATLVCPPDDGSRTDGDPGFDEDAVYAVVRAAMKDAMLDVIGTVLLVGVALVVFWAGLMLVVSGGGSPGGVAVGVAAVVFSVYLAGSAVDLVPSVWEWV